MMKRALILFIGSVAVGLTVGYVLVIIELFE
jgi:hypothetical protein